MWFLEHESLFGGKRIWLRPGSQQLYGRTTKGVNGEEGRNVFIDHKAVSRQHMMIKVLDAPAEGGSKLHARSQVEITDLSCRQGTFVDEDKKLVSKKEGGSIVEYDKLILSGTEHKIKLISSYPSFLLKWQPVVFTFASKESKSRSSQLHKLDIKTTSDFVFHKTTHVVSQKRNLPKVLQGLVAGVHIVTTEYLDAILDRASPQNTDPNNYIPSKLEEDFDLWWPSEKEYVPPVGAEPVPRDGRLLEPDNNRAEVFSGLTFVFLNENQHSSLHQPISGGGGKVLLFDVRPGETTVEEYVEYVHNVAGKKKSSNASNGRLPVITIRLPAFPEGLEEWATHFVTGVDQALNQRSILQNEFLDAIITNDRSSLQKPPPELEPSSSLPQVPMSQNAGNERETRSQSRAPSQPLENVPSQAEETIKTVPRKRTFRRGATASRFTGFDDYEPPTKLRKVEEDTAMDDIKSPVDTQEPQLSSHALRLATQRSQRLQSPAVPSVEPTEEADQMDTLFPAAAAVKRQRAATRGVSASVEPDAQAAPREKTKGEQVLERLQKAKKKANKDIDVREAARSRLQQQEEKRKADEDSLREALEGVDISEIRGLVKVEEMTIKPRQGRAVRQQEDGSGQRWNEEWNGRKNFKKFRRRGGENVPQRAKVIVALEQAPQKKGFGLGDAFFLEEEPAKSREGEERRKRKKACADEDPAEVSEPEPGFTRRKKGNQPEVINVEDSEPEDVVLVPASAGTRASGRTQRVEETQLGDMQNQTQTQTQTQRGAKKRGAPVVVAPAGPSKRARTRRREDDSDDEETGFRLRRRG